jgi:hypothetical protein
MNATPLHLENDDMNAAARKPRLGDQRYIAVWCDKDALLKAARKEGWTDDADHGQMSYIDHADFEYSLSAASFDDAVMVARAKVEADFFGCPRVYLQEFGPDDVPAAAREWEDVKFWDIPAEGEPEEQSA